MAGATKLMRSIPSAAVTVIVGGSGGGTATALSGTSITTGVLATGAIESGSVSLAKALTVFGATVGTPARIRLYSTAAARDADVNRSNMVPVTPGSQHGMILDLYLNTSDKFTWVMSPPAQGASADTPQTATIYYSITNLSTSSRAITATLTYLPQEN